MQALSMAIPNILNVLIISVLFFIIFGIIGVNYFKGQFSYCYSDHLDDSIYSATKSAITDKWNCINTGGEWQLKYYHFDNIINAMMTLFQIATLSGWSTIMYNGMSLNGLDQEFKIVLINGSCNFSLTFNLND
jgi:hypothetical protein